MKLDELAEFYIFYIDTINHSSDVRYISGKVSTPGAKGKIVSGWEQSLFIFFCYILLEIKADQETLIVACDLGKGSVVFSMGW